MPSASSCVLIGGYTPWSEPSTASPRSRASAASPPMKVPQMPRMCSFTSPRSHQFENHRDPRAHRDAAGRERTVAAGAAAGGGVGLHHHVLHHVALTVAAAIAVVTATRIAPLRPRPETVAAGILL